MSQESDVLARRRSPQRPQPPPKDHRSTVLPPSSNNTIGTRPRSDYLPIPSSTGLSSAYNSRGKGYIPSDQELADAVRDSVQIRAPSPRTSALGAGKDLPTLIDVPAVSGGAPVPPVKQRRSPSPRMPGATVTRSVAFQPGHSHSLSSPDMSGLSQPTLGKAGDSTNPFEVADVVSGPGAACGAITRSRGEGAGTVHPSRQKFSRAMTTHTTTPSSASQTPLLAPNSPPENPGPLNNAGVGAGTRNRVRRSMSTDSYGRDSSTPNARELMAGQKKAAADKKGSKHADIIDRWDPTGLGNAMWHHSGPYDIAAPSRSKDLPRSSAAANASPSRNPPDLPAKDSTAAAANGSTGTAAQPHKIRAQSTSARRSSGGLTGQYSTSVPVSGGYFPDMDAPQDEATLARIERQREREQKRRALKAAWGIDTPEPFEDFGLSPNEQAKELAIEEEPVEFMSAIASNKPLKSPGLRLGTSSGPRTPPIKEHASSPTTEQPPASIADLPGAGAAGRPGVKRTKSLMQKIKTMVRTRSDSVESVPPVPLVHASAVASVSASATATATASGRSRSESGYAYAPSAESAGGYGAGGSPSPTRSTHAASVPGTATHPPLPEGGLLHHGQRSQSMSAVGGQAGGRGLAVVGLPPGGRGVVPRRPSAGPAWVERVVHEEEEGMVEVYDAADEDDRFADAEEDVFGRQEQAGLRSREMGKWDRGAERLVQPDRRRESKSNIPFRAASPSKNLGIASPNAVETPLKSPPIQVGLVEPNPFVASGTTVTGVGAGATEIATSANAGVGIGGLQTDDAMEVIDQDAITAKTELENGFVVVDSPNSKARSRSAAAAAAAGGTASGGDVPPVPAMPASISYRGNLAGASGGVSRPNDSFRPLDRVKTLPPPPVGQVIPDFDDILAGNNRRGSMVDRYSPGLPDSSEGGGGAVGAGPGAGVRRKSSVVKKLKDRIVK